MVRCGNCGNIPTGQIRELVEAGMACRQTPECITSTQAEVAFRAEAKAARKAVKNARNKANRQARAAANSNRPKGRK